MSVFKTKKEILDFIKEFNLPLYPISGVLAYTFIPEKQIDGIILPDTIKAGDVLKGVIVSEPINCDTETGLKFGVEILYKAKSGVPLNINGHQFHKLEEPEILAIISEDNDSENS